MLYEVINMVTNLARSMQASVREEDESKYSLAAFLTSYTERE